ncbi:XdhC family protein [Confluentibacter lentus]|uniref:XdhC family protein n=1 Tax=Confluentibacter lentus TaxID=1699412 RepID=UPI000C288F70|nr:XdhC/CoxI family protein [Confluentibacter lentus]
MTHEFKDIVQQGLEAKRQRIKSVLASVVALDGSSYRRPGVRMLILENNSMVGAVSGGCVEKEILLQSQSVFKTGQSKIMTYDGRYRLGCEGILYILLESFQPNEAFETAFSECIKERYVFEIHSYFTKHEGSVSGLGSFVKLKDTTFSLGNLSKAQSTHLSVFKQTLPACSKLVIVGAEHDAVQLCKYAALTGWDVTIIAGVKEAKTIDNFPGASDFHAISPEEIDVNSIDNQTSIVLMTHSFANDLRFLVALKNTNPNYIGVLGPTKRREDLLAQFIEYCPDVEDTFLECIHGPAGIDIGSETPQEIAISIMAEILAVTRKRDTISLSKKSGKIHSN